MEEESTLSTEEAFLRMQFPVHASNNESEFPDASPDLPLDTAMAASPTPAPGSVPVSASVPAPAPTPAHPPGPLKRSGRTPLPSGSAVFLARPPTVSLDLGNLSVKPLDIDLLRDFRFYSVVQLSNFVRPKGTPVGHLCEHTGPITQLKVSQDNIFFASASYDGTVKVSHN